MNESEKTIEDVRRFWNENPLWTGESEFEPGTLEFFEEHRKVYIEDCFAGEIDSRLFPGEAKGCPVLDLGCGVGFWLVEFGNRGFQDLHGADLTPNSLEIARKRCDIYGIHARLSEQNAEKTEFDDGEFGHVNCLGVVHHTPNPGKAVAEIARIVRPGGTASISVYYKNLPIRAWPIFRPFAKVFARLGAKLSGRGREKIFELDSVDDIIRVYDGDENPIGIGYTKKEFVEELGKSFEVEEIYYHFFPARSLPFALPGWMHRVLNRRLPFMIVARLRKPE